MKTHEPTNDSFDIEFNDALLDLLLKYAAKEEAERQVTEANRIIEEEWEHPAVKPSFFFRLRMKRLYRQIKKKGTAADGSYRGRKRAVSFAVAVVLVLLLASIATYAAHSKYFKFLLHDFGTHTEIDFIEESEVPQYTTEIDPEWNPVYYPAYLPEGYRLDKTFCNDASYGYAFVNGEDWIDISISRVNGGSTTVIDTEDAKIEPIMINGYEGLSVEKNGNKILYHDDSHLFIVYSSHESHDIVVDIAENFRF